MKATRVLLRWYKSFNTSYGANDDRQKGAIERPWNAVGVADEVVEDNRFIELSLEPEITTIVGANESGKSHLLSAISKVLLGVGIPHSDGKEDRYERTDLCHYASVLTKDTNVWPHIGVQFADLNEASAGCVQQLTKSTATIESFTLVLCPSGDSRARLYLDCGEAADLSEEELETLRKHLPVVEFIQSDVPLPDQVPIDDLIVAMGGQGGSPEPLYGYDVGQQAAALLKALSVTPAGPNQQPTISTEDAERLSKLRTAVSADQSTHQSVSTAARTLEGQLFRDILKIDLNSLRYIARLPESDRGYIDSVVAKWNHELEETLNLSHYWQQDEQFQLRINYKRRILFFEIIDRTGAVYTFRERSSGLKYFLSYYIQAKALEQKTKGRSCILLMDEPDSFLSIAGQRSLLAVFESLVRRETSAQNTQLIYTTHSPFLLSRNFPQRIRLVRKGDAEEGTQHVPAVNVRRYEPVRSALGVDCAQTLFMGATNVLLEGPADQYLISELVRHYATPSNVSEYIDLNAVVLVSAGSASMIEKVLAASRWGDEPVPATVALVDNDDAGLEARSRITGDKGKARNKPLLEGDLCVTLSDLIEAATTMEDLVPSRLYGQAVYAYAEKWFPDVFDANQGDLRSRLVESADFGNSGNVAATKKVFNEVITPGKASYDKLGVLQSLVHVLPSAESSLSKELDSRFRAMCQSLRDLVEVAESRQRRDTGRQAIARRVKTFFVNNRGQASTHDLMRLLKSLKSDAELLGDDGSQAINSLNRWATEAESLLSAGQSHLTAEQLTQWKHRFEALRKNPQAIDDAPKSNLDSHAGDMSLGLAARPSELDAAASKPEASYPTDAANGVPS